MAAIRVATVFLVALGASSGVKTARDTASTLGSNPIRKVVGLMENMQAKIEAENEKDEELYEKFECHCKKTQKQLEDEIAKANAIGNVKPEDIEAKEAELKALKQSIEDLKKDNVEDEKTLASEKAQRGKEHEEYVKVEKEDNETEDAAEGAIKALGGSPSNATSFLSLIQGAGTAFSRQLTALLQGNAPATTGEALGMVKSVEEDAVEDWKEQVAKDEEDKKQYAAIKKNKEKSIKTVLEQLTKKAKKVGDLRVEIVNMKHALEGGAKQLAENKKLLAELKKDCAQRASEQQEKKVLQAEEQKALQDTVKMLTSDDALDLFRKTIKKPSFLQLDTSREQAREKAMQTVSSLKASAGRPEISLIALALSGKKVDFTAVFKKIENMTALMLKEGADDKKKKEYCNEEFDKAADTSKGLKAQIKDLAGSIDQKKTSIEQLEADIKSIKEGVENLDKSVTEATENRKAESAEFNVLVNDDSAAIELLGMAKNRLNKFYNPKLYSDTTTTGPYDMGLVQEQEQKPQVQESNGVLSLVSTMITDLEKEILVAKTDEQHSQEEYQATVADAKEKREGDLANMQSKEQVKAETAGDLSEDSDESDSTVKKLEAASNVEKDLHEECDWLLANFDIRKEARTAEIEQLKTAKATLAGADFSFL